MRSDTSTDNATIHIQSTIMSRLLQSFRPVADLVARQAGPSRLAATRSFGFVAPPSCGPSLSNPSAHDWSDPARHPVHADLVPYVVERTVSPFILLKWPSELMKLQSAGERSVDIFSRLLKERVVFLGEAC